MLGKELLKEALEKSGEPWTQASACSRASGSGALIGPNGESSFRSAPQHVPVRSQAAQRLVSQAEGGVASVIEYSSGVWISQDQPGLPHEWWASRLSSRAASSPRVGADGSQEEAQGPPRRREYGFTDEATHRNHVWTWDFVHDTTVRGGYLRMLNVIDEYTRECLRIHVARRIKAHKIWQVMSDLIDVHDAPGHIRSDNGSEFIKGQLQTWLKDNEIDTLYIDPGSPLQNGHSESSNARLREEASIANSCGR